MNECCKDFIKIYQSRTLEYCKKIASKYTSKTEWHKTDRKSYKYAYKYGWLEECSKHFKK